MRSTLQRIALTGLVLALAALPLRAQESKTNGKTSLGFNASIGSTTNDRNDDYTLRGMGALSLTHFTGGGHLEIGGALNVFGTGTTVGSTTTGSTTINPNFVVRVNSSGLGREKNTFLYVGGTGGASVLMTDSQEGTVTSTSPSYGFQLGMNQFVTSNAALNVQGDYIFSNQTIAGKETQYFDFTLSLGVRVFF